MTRSDWKRPVVVLVLVIAGFGGGVWAQDPHGSPGGVAVRSKGGLGQYLTDSKGMTLYLYTREIGDRVECGGLCAVAWPPFYSASITAPAQLKQSDFGKITRHDGSQQSTYKGWPLYYYFTDRSPGDTRGEGLFKDWYVVRVPFYTLMPARLSKLGNFLVDGEGRTLYYSRADSVDRSACSAGCIETWPEEHAATIIVPSTMEASRFGTFTRQDGRLQTTFEGRPLYRYSGDQNPGQTNGQGLHGSWFVVNPFNFTP
jgi:predicted lipoprotein with Yx(FWY)xxD motif